MLSIVQISVLLVNVLLVQGFRTYSSDKSASSIEADEETPINTASTITYYYSELTLVGNCRLLQDETDISLRQLASSFLAKFGVTEPSLQIVDVACDTDFVVKFYTSHTSLGMNSLYYCPEELFCQCQFNRIRFTVHTFLSEIPQIFESKPTTRLNRRTTYLVLIGSTAFGLVAALIGGVMALYCGWFSSTGPKYVYTLGIAAYNETPKIFATKTNVAGPTASTSATANADRFPAAGGETSFLEMLHKNDNDYDSVDETASVDSFSSDEQFDTSQEILSLVPAAGSVPDFRPPLPTAGGGRVQLEQDPDPSGTDVAGASVYLPTGTETKQTPVPVAKETAKEGKIGLTSIRFIDDSSPCFRIETDL